MIDVLTEDLIDLREAAKLAPFRRAGKAANVATIYRYVQRGARAVNGERVRLPTVRTPGGLKTSRQAVVRWLHELTHGEAPTSEPIEQAKQLERASAVLTAAGI